MLKNGIVLENISGISLYVDDIEKYATEFYYLYSQLLNNQENQARALLDVRVTSDTRAKVALETSKAILENTLILRKILSDLSPHVDKFLLATFRPNPGDANVSVLKDFKYLKRDWGGDAASEKQLSLIRQGLSSALESNGSKFGAAAFLGAGLCRIAYDLVDYFQNVYAIDKSFSMAYHFRNLLQEDIIFNEIDFKNIYKPEHSVRTVRAAISNIENRTTALNKLQKINYLVSDVTMLPFADKSLDCVFSVYFTDVIALKLWLPEIKRVLKPDGLFIHFGPVDYFFSELNEMLTPEEIKLVLKNNGFIDQYESFIETVHLPIEQGLVNVIYNNWLFVAKLNEEFLSSKLGLDTILQVDFDISFSITGNFYKEKEKNYTLMIQNQETITITHDVYQILEFLIEPKTVSEIILLKEIALSDDLSDAEKNLIMNLIQELVSKKILRVIDQMNYQV